MFVLLVPCDGLQFRKVSILCQIIGYYDIACKGLRDLSIISDSRYHNKNVARICVTQSLESASLMFQFVDINNNCINDIVWSTGCLVIDQIPVRKYHLELYQCLIKVLFYFEIDNSP